MRNISFHIRNVKTVFYVLIIVLAMVCSACSFFIVRRETSQVVEENSTYDVVQEMNQMMTYTMTVVDNYVNQLSLLAEFLSYEKIDKVSLYNKIGEANNELFQIGLVDQQGLSYIFKQATKDVSGEGYVKQALQGQQVLRCVMRDLQTHSQVLVFATPIFNENKVVGALTGELDLTMLAKKMENPSIKGHGFTTFIEKQANLSDTSLLSSETSFYNHIRNGTLKKGTKLEDIQHHIQQGLAGQFEIQVHATNYKVYYRPTQIKGWTICTFVDTQNIDTLSVDILGLIMTWMVTNFALYCLVGLVLFLLVKSLREEVKESQKDCLTQLMNRKEWEKKVHHELRNKTKRNHACLFLDVDDFKTINDQQGHNKGDQALIELASLLRNSFRESDLICRYGGDEFLVWIKEFEKYSVIQDKAEALCRKAKKLQCQEVKVSIGIAIYPLDSCNVQQLIQMADQSMYQSKNEGKDRVTWANEAYLKQELKLHAQSKRKKPHE